MMAMAAEAVAAAAKAEAAKAAAVEAAKAAAAAAAVAVAVAVAAAGAAAARAAKAEPVAHLRSMAGRAMKWAPTRLPPKVLPAPQGQRVATALGTAPKAPRLVAMSRMIRLIVAAPLAMVSSTFMSLSINMCVFVHVHGFQWFSHMACSLHQPVPLWIYSLATKLSCPYPSKTGFVGGGAAGNGTPEGEAEDGAAQGGRENATGQDTSGDESEGVVRNSRDSTPANRNPKQDQDYLTKLLLVGDW